MIAVRYAKALFELAEEKGVLEVVAQDLQGIAKVLKEEPSLQEFLENPVVKEGQKKELLQMAFKGSVQPMVTSLLDLLVTKKREVFLPAVCLVFQQLYKEKEGYREVVLTTATPASKEVQTLLQNKIADSLKTKVDIKTEVDEDLVGGFKLRIDDMLMDRSIATQLQNIRKELLNK